MNERAIMIPTKFEKNETISIKAQNWYMLTICHTPSGKQEGAAFVPSL
jgi:hypothetical protein